MADDDRDEPHDMHNCCVGFLLEVRWTHRMDRGPTNCDDRGNSMEERCNGRSNSNHAYSMRGDCEV